MELGRAATPRASTALPLSGLLCMRAASSQMSSLVGQNSQPFCSSSRACAPLPACLRTASSRSGVYQESMQRLPENMIHNF